MTQDSSELYNSIEEFANGTSVQNNTLSIAKRILTKENYSNFYPILYEDNESPVTSLLRDTLEETLERKLFTKETLKNFFHKVLSYYMKDNTSFFEALPKNS